MSDSKSGKVKRKQHVRWYHRLSLKLTIPWTATLLLTYFFSPELFEGLRSFLGFDELPEGIIIVEDDWLSGTLLLGSERAESGRWVPSAEGFRSFEQNVQPLGVYTVWLDMEQTVVAASEVLDVPAGVAWGSEVRPSDTFFDVDGGDHRLTSCVVEHEGEAAGILISIEWDRAQHASYVHGTTPEELEDGYGCEFEVEDPIYMTENEVDGLVRREQALKTTLSVLGIILLAALVGLCVSMLVTRRLSRLARDASFVFAGTETVAGSFDQSGQDEIALVAANMNLMRERLARALGDLSQRDSSRREWIAQVSHDQRAHVCPENLGIVLGENLIGTTEAGQESGQGRA